MSLEPKPAPSSTQQRRESYVEALLDLQPSREVSFRTGTAMRSARPLHGRRIGTAPQGRPGYEKFDPPGLSHSEPKAGDVEMPGSYLRDCAEQHQCYRTCPNPSSALFRGGHQRGNQRSADQT